MKQLEEQTSRVSLLCCVSHRSQRLQDHRITSVISHVRQYTDSAQEAAKDRVYEYRDESNEHLQKAGPVLKLFTAAAMAAPVPFHEVQAKAFAILEREKLDCMADHITKNARFDARAFQWEPIDDVAPQFPRPLRPILLTVHWAASSGSAPLIEAVPFLQDILRTGRPLGPYPPATLPLRFLPDPAHRSLYTQDEHGHRHLLPDRYEFLVSRLLRHGLEAGDVFCRASVRFRSFADDLLDDQRGQDKATLLANTRLPLLKQPIQEH